MHGDRGRSPTLIDRVEPNCAKDRTASQRTVGYLAPGLQTGFCQDTGGGWGERLTVHRSQLHAVPDGLSTERAVLVEPLACAVQLARRAQVAPGASVSPAWFRELEVAGTYASCGDAFTVALGLAEHAPLDDVVGGRYPLHRWREALDHAHSAGRLGTVKVCFDVRSRT